MKKIFDKSAAFLIFENVAVNFSSVKKVYTEGCYDYANCWYKSIVIDLFEEKRFKQLTVFDEAEEKYIDKVFSGILEGLYKNKSVDLRLEEKTLKYLKEMNE